MFLEGILPGMARYGGASGVRFLFGVVIYPRSQGYFLYPPFCAKIKCCTDQLNPPPKIVSQPVHFEGLLSGKQMFGVEISGDTSHPKLTI